jgi:Flp pilus assembly protein TadD
METGVETHRLRQEIDRALRRAFAPADVLPRLAKLARHAAAGSDDAVFAHRQLAELLVERHPWRAAIHAKKALEHRPADDRAWAVLAFCHTLLGNFRSAVSAYKQAVACAPGNPWYAHNLGHLLDVAVGAPERALAWLEAAYQAKPDNTEIVASYVHALGRVGREAEARVVLERALDRFDSNELEALSHWLDQGAPSHPDLSEVERPARKPRVRVPRSRRLARVLERGMSHLPLDDQQRERALAMARDALERPSSRDVSAAAKREDMAGLAAAVAYAIVYVDHVPLSQAEVAAPFRVGVGRLRGRFAELRAKLDLIRGDARYATTRR